MEGRGPDDFEKRMTVGAMLAAFEWEWGWTVHWFGWRRMLWLAVSIDFHCKTVSVIFFGILFGWGRKLKPATYATTRSRP